MMNNKYTPTEQIRQYTNIIDMINEGGFTYMHLLIKDLEIEVTDENKLYTISLIESYIKELKNI